MNRTLALSLMERLLAHVAAGTTSLADDEARIPVEWIQSGLSSGANESFALGRYESPIRWFHNAVDQALAT